ncbi:hypothetical protein BS47DRAFT_1370597 [Hydnum rufescens UP504]|uniref:SET domain-containing protein n=1 Tax=Hydnum rufescens UP504 TaxID=1448309 RepID=A0A9P6B9C3_9AGAM|nr:hypothetical protein BS47DRAFT_1370597 [Hydnum rufescens UP504]
MRLRARFPPHEYSEVLNIVRASNTHQGVDSLLILPSVAKYLKTKTLSQINAFATHALRYLILYQCDCPVEIAQTYRYASRTGKGELCVLASQSIPAGHPIHHLQGSLAPLSLKQETILESDLATGRDFGIIRLNGRSFLLLGPVRFVNIIRVKALRRIAVGEEITISYAPAYFGDDNQDCLCLSCERAGMRGSVAYLQHSCTVEDRDGDLRVLIIGTLCRTRTRFP